MTTITAERNPIITEARKLHQKYPGLSAMGAIRWARDAAERAELWGDLEFDCNGSARIERDGFTIHAQYTVDEQPDLWVGEYTDTWRPGAIKHLAGWDGSNYTRPNNRVYGWFVPATDAEEARRWYAKAGYARHDAWLTAQRQARSDYNRMNEITLWDLKVTVFRAGVELAVDYLGAIDLGDDLRDVDTDEQRVIMAIDSIDSALFEAKATMQALAVEFAKSATID